MYTTEVNMKKFGVLTATLLLGIQFAHAAGSKESMSREWESFEDSRFVYSINVTLPNTAGAVSTVTIPSESKGFRLFPSSAGVRWAIGTSALNYNGSVAFSTPTLAALATSTSPGHVEIATTTLSLGGMTQLSIWETRLLPYTGTIRKLYLRAPTAGAVVDVEFFK
jgi:hypothetical protein